MTIPADRDPATQRRQQVLDDLLAVGMRFVHRADRRAEAEPETLPEMAEIYEHVSRAVRRTIALQHHLDQAPRRTAARAAARRRIMRVVEDAIAHRAPSDAQAERLTAELHERLDAPELDDEIGDRPVDEVIADICRDLGLSSIDGIHIYKRRTPADIIELASRAARPPRSASDPANEPERFFRNIPSPNGVASPARAPVETAPPRMAPLIRR